MGDLFLSSEKGRTFVHFCRLSLKQVVRITLDRIHGGDDIPPPCLCIAAQQMVLLATAIN